MTRWYTGYPLKDADFVPVSFGIGMACAACSFLVVYNIWMASGNIENRISTASPEAYRHRVTGRRTTENFPPNRVSIFIPKVDANDILEEDADSIYNDSTNL